MVAIRLRRQLGVHRQARLGKADRQGKTSSVSSASLQIESTVALPQELRRLAGVGWSKPFYAANLSTLDGSPVRRYSSSENKIALKKRSVVNRHRHESYGFVLYSPAE
jgi:hypothetical protein